MSIQPYLMFDGNAEEAFSFYEKALGGKILMLSRYGDMPPEGGDPVPPDVARRIMHIRIDIGGAILMASDCHPARAGVYTGIHGVSIALGFEDPAEGRKAFDALADGARVEMPYAPTFWSEGFGMLVDRFGVPWMVNAGEKAPG